MPGVERFAIVGINTDAHLLAQAEFHLEVPVRIGDRLSCRRNDVRFSVLQHTFGLDEAVNAAGGNDRRRESGVANCTPHPGDRRKVAAERSFFVRDVLRHAFIAATPGVGIRRSANFRLFRVFKFTAAR